MVVEEKMWQKELEEHGFCMEEGFRKAWLDPELINSLFKESQLTRGRLKCFPCLLITTKHQGNFFSFVQFSPLKA